MAKKKEMTVKVYISRHNLVTNEIFNMVKDLFLNESCEVTYYTRGETYTNIPIKQSDLLVLLPWWDDLKYKIGKGTFTELSVAMAHDNAIISYCHPDGKYRALERVQEHPSDDWKYVAHLAMGEIANIPELVARILENLEKHGRKEISKEKSKDGDPPAII